VRGHAGDARGAVHGVRGPDRGGGRRAVGAVVARQGSGENASADVCGEVAGPALPHGLRLATGFVGGVHPHPHATVVPHPDAVAGRVRDERRARAAHSLLQYLFGAADRHVYPPVVGQELGVRVLDRDGRGELRRPGSVGIHVRRAAQCFEVDDGPGHDRHVATPVDLYRWRSVELAGVDPRRNDPRVRVLRRLRHLEGNGVFAFGTVLIVNRGTHRALALRSEGYLGLAAASAGDLIGRLYRPDQVLAELAGVGLVDVVYHGRHRIGLSPVGDAARLDV